MAGGGELEAELALLREENARLKVERHRPADAGHVIERMRSLRQDAFAQPDGEPREAAEGAQAIAECLAVREGLMDACQEAQQAMRGIRGRLEALTGDIQGRAGEQPTSETDDAAEVSSDFAQSVA